MSGQILSSGGRLIAREREHDVLARLLHGVLVVDGAAASARRCSRTGSRLRAGFGSSGRPGSSSEGALDGEQPLADDE
jgi:hypothetical protein